MRVGKGTIIVSLVGHGQKGTCSQLREEENELDTSGKSRVVQV